MTNKKPIRTKIIYDFFSDSGKLIYRTAYSPTSYTDYERVMKLFEEQPAKYQFVSAEYGFEWGEAKK